MSLAWRPESALRESLPLGGEGAALRGAAALPEASRDDLPVEDDRGAALEGVADGLDRVVVDDALAADLDRELVAGGEAVDRVRAAVRDGRATGLLRVDDGEGFAFIDDPVRSRAGLWAEEGEVDWRDGLDAVEPREGAAGRGDEDRDEFRTWGAFCGDAWELRLRSA